MQSDSGPIDIIRPDTPKPDAARPDSAKADSPRPDANSIASTPAEPTDAKARKTFANAMDWEKHKYFNEALGSFRKANQQDGGRCSECLLHAYALAVRLGAYKDAVEISRKPAPFAQTDAEKARVHFRLGTALLVEAIEAKENRNLQDSCNEFKSALETDPKMSRVRYHWGIALAHLYQDDAARAQFSAFLDQERKNPSLHERAERFMDRIELARASMAPQFMAKTIDGQNISLDSLAGKVVLIDFWATWCGPCVAALPHIQHIARKFDGQPLVMISISLDSNEDEWQTFVEKNKLTWMQVRDGGFNGAVSKKFGVTAIPATFTIDADGVLEDQHVGDADIEGKLKKLVAHAAEANNRKPAPVTADASPGSGN